MNIIFRLFDLTLLLYTCRDVEARKYLNHLIYELCAVRRQDRNSLRKLWKKEMEKFNEETKTQS